MFHHESRIPIYFEVKRSKVKVTSTKISACMIFALVSASFFILRDILFNQTLSMVLKKLKRTQQNQKCTSKPKHIYLIAIFLFIYIS